MDGVYTEWRFANGETVPAVIWVTCNSARGCAGGAEFLARRHTMARIKLVGALIGRMANDIEHARERVCHP